MNPGASIKEKLRGRSFVMISPHSNRRRKDWPLERFGRLARWLADKFDLRCLFVGGESSREILSASLPFDGERQLNGAGELTFAETLELLPSAVLIVGNDSALGHYAGLREIPSLILFSAAHSLSAWAPQEGRFICLQAQVPCRLCSFRIEGCDHDHLCMKAITLEMAQQACLRLLRLPK
jgi:ADP-heptose:LPS heptosyltransferase